MPKYIELGHTGVVHESEIFGAAMPPMTEQEDPVESEGKKDESSHV